MTELPDIAGLTGHHIRWHRRHLRATRLLSWCTLPLVTGFFAVMAMWARHGSWETALAALSLIAITGLLSAAAASRVGEAAAAFQITSFHNHVVTLQEKSRATQVRYEVTIQQDAAAEVKNEVSRYSQLRRTGRR